MERTEAEGKLRHYHADFGDWIYSASVEEVVAKAQEAREQADSMHGERKLRKLGEAVQLHAVADCLTVIGDDRPTPPTTTNVRSLAAHKETKEVFASARVAAATEADIDPEFPEEPVEVFNMLDLTTRAAQPRFKRGDRAWTADYDEDGSGNIVGYVPVIVTGMIIYPDEVMYFIGFYDEVEGTVSTNFHDVCDDEIWEEMPDTLTPVKSVKKPKRDSSHLSVVK